MVCFKTFNCGDTSAETITHYSLTKYIQVQCLKIVITVYLPENVQHLSTRNKILRC